MTSSIDGLRDREYPDLDGVFLNSASYGLLARRTVEAINGLTARRNRPRGIPEAEPGAALRRARHAAASLLDVDLVDVTLAPNTSYGVNLAVALVRAGPPGRVILSEGEFPANVLPWLPLREEGFSIELVPTVGGLPDEATLREAAAQPEVRAVGVSAVQYATGYRVDLEALGEVCRRCGVLLLVDAIQALGVVPLRPRDVGVDLVATGGQKWLCAPWGSGFVWLAPEHREKVRPPIVSWLAVEGGAAYSTDGGYHLDYLNDGRRFEPATLGVQDYLGLAVAIELLQSVGVDRIRRHVEGLHAPVLDWARARDDVRVVTPLQPERRAGILALDLPDAEGAFQALDRAGIQGAVREGLLRLAPHLYVRESEMMRVVEVLDREVG